MAAHSNDSPVSTIARMSCHELPASVRVALWATSALGGGLEMAEVPRRAMPDLDECEGLSAALQVWRDLGEQVVLVALPRPGDLVGMPPAGPELLAAATAAAECVFVPGTGATLVPTIEQFGPAGDQGWISRWRTFDAGPMPVHRVEALDLGQTELELRTELAALTQELAAAGAPPFGASAERGVERARAAQRSAGKWGLPEGLPPRAVRVIDLAGTVLVLTDAGLDSVVGSLDASTTGRRTELLRRLQSHATRALADATNAAALHLAFRR